MDLYVCISVCMYVYVDMHVVFYKRGNGGMDMYVCVFFFNECSNGDFECMFVCMLSFKYRSNMAGGSSCIYLCMYACWYASSISCKNVFMHAICSKNDIEACCLACSPCIYARQNTRI
jgi:hypothetical protein